MQSLFRLFVSIFHLEYLGYARTGNIRQKFTILFNTLCLFTEMLSYLYSSEERNSYLDIYEGHNSSLTKKNKKKTVLSLQANKFN